uniref:Uncharacterized protein n=1 Tax=Kalanchoe fedtschenkoi TaxID=63787 RepID=A0A7N0RD89_KALFE
MYSRGSMVRERERERGVAGDRKGPSFSSTLLDEIYRSIDDGSARQECGKTRTSRKDEEAAERARLVKKWMEQKNKKVGGGGGGDGESKKRNNSPEKMELDKTKLHYVDNDPLFFSSGSTSSDSNSSLFSEHETIPLPTGKTRSSCFLPPKPIRTRVKPEKKSGAKTENYSSETEHEDAPPSTKSRALKLYANLKKMKQPISPGVKLTTFINSILSNSKKPSKRATPSFAAADEDRSTPKPACCSSTSSFTRSRLNQSSSTGASSVKCTVRFVSIKTDESPLPSRTLKRDEQEKLRLQLIEKNRAPTKPSSKTPLHKPVTIAAEDQDCAASDCSDDLFEIDHLKLSNGRRSGELPVYESTRVGSSNHNRPVMKGLKL